jgi:hypothetical protein
MKTFIIVILSLFIVASFTGCDNVRIVVDGTAVASQTATIQKLMSRVDAIEASIVSEEKVVDIINELNDRAAIMIKLECKENKWNALNRQAMGSSRFNEIKIQNEKDAEEFCEL